MPLHHSSPLFSLPIFTGDPLDQELVLFQPKKTVMTVNARCATLRIFLCHILAPDGVLS
jgi:hypothetical protein